MLSDLRDYFAESPAFNTALNLPTFSRPRCLCHNKYLEKCPNQRTSTERQILGAVLEQPEIIRLLPSPEKCKKHGHRSRGKAEAQLRSLLRRQLETNSKGGASTLEVYKCRRIECKDHPWHVGHNPYVRREV